MRRAWLLLLLTGCIERQAEPDLDEIVDGGLVVDVTTPIADAARPFADATVDAEVDAAPIDPCRDPEESDLEVLWPCFPATSTPGYEPHAGCEYFFNLLEAPSEREGRPAFEAGLQRLARHGWSLMARTRNYRYSLEWYSQVMRVLSLRAQEGVEVLCLEEIGGGEFTTRVYLKHNCGLEAVRRGASEFRQEGEPELPFLDARSFFTPPDGPMATELRVEAGVLEALGRPDHVPDPTVPPDCFVKWVESQQP